MNRMTIGELLSELEELDIIKLVEEKRESDRYVSKSAIYGDVDGIIKGHIKKCFEHIENLGVYNGIENGNSKDRDIELKRIIRNENGYAGELRFLFWIGYSVSLYKISSNKWGLKSVEIKQNFNDEIKNKTIEDILKEDIEKEEEVAFKNKNVEVPKHIENSKLLFDRILKAMEDKKKISWSDEYDLKQVVKEYNNLMGFK